MDRPKHRGRRQDLTLPAPLLRATYSHYEDPAYYSFAYRQRNEDIGFYASYARVWGGPVLEYGAGNGRIALPLARAGLHVTAVDSSLPMLRDLKRQLADEPADVRKRVRAQQGDMRKLRLRRKFPLVLCTFNTFLHLYSAADVTPFLAAVRHHLAPGGKFLVDTLLPHPADLARDPSRTYATPRFRHPTFNKVVRYTERFEYDPIAQILWVTMEFLPVDGSAPWTTTLAHRQYFPQELKALFASHGFHMEVVYGGFSGEPLDRHSEVAVWQLVAKPS